MGFLDIYIDAHTASNEFWDLYPAYSNSNGVNYPLMLVDRVVFRETYNGIIKGNREEHNEIMKDLKYAVDNDMIKGTITKFVTSEQWTKIRPLRISATESDTTVTNHITNERDF